MDKEADCQWTEEQTKQRIAEGVRVYYRELRELIAAALSNYRRAPAGGG
jgi:hypothetical protein